MTSTTTRDIAFTAPVPRTTWTTTRRFPAGTTVYTRTRRNGTTVLRIPGTLWEITANASAYTA